MSLYFKNAFICAELLLRFNVRNSGLNHNYAIFKSPKAKRRRNKSYRYNALLPMRWSNEQVTIVQDFQRYTHRQRASTQKSHI